MLGRDNVLRKEEEGERGREKYTIETGLTEIVIKACGYLIIIMCKCKVAVTIVAWVTELSLGRERAAEFAGCVLVPCS